MIHEKINLKERAISKWSDIAAEERELTYKRRIMVTSLKPWKSSGL